MTIELKHPVPFEIIEQDKGMRVASNGTLRMMVLGAEGKLFRRRAITGIQAKPAAEMLIPLLNGLVAFFPDFNVKNGQWPNSTEFVFTPTARMSSSQLRK